jgi:hypothetical protein
MESTTRNFEVSFEGMLIKFQILTTQSIHSFLAPIIFSIDFLFFGND